MEIEQTEALPQPLADTPPLAERSRGRRVRLAAILVTGVVLAVNAGLLATAVGDRSWTALNIAILSGPITNGVLLLLGLLGIPLVKSGAAGAPVRSYVITAVGLPLAAIPADFLLIFSMGLHGC
jgi:hypothetical protein